MLFTIDMRYFGRKLFIKWGLIASGSSCIISTILLNQKFKLLGAISAYIGKLFIAGTFQAIFQYVIELYSTDIRPEALSLCNIFARLGGIIFPVILCLSEFLVIYF